MNIGNTVAYAYAVIYPDKVLRLVVLDAPNSGDRALSEILLYPVFGTSTFHWELTANGWWPDVSASTWIAYGRFHRRSLPSRTNATRNSMRSLTRSQVYAGWFLQLHRFFSGRKGTIRSSSK